MKKSRFISGCVSLSMATVIGVTSIANMVETTNAQKLIGEFVTTNVSAEVEWSAVEKNILTDSDFSSSETNSNIFKNAEDSKKVEKEVESVIIVESNNSEETTKKDKKELKKEKKQNKNKNKNKKKNKNKNNNKKQKDNNLEYVGNFKVTGYCSCVQCCGKSNGITASGTHAKAGRTIAADTSLFPFGTELVINGHTYTVEDRGGAIGGYKIDMFFSSHQEALNWGVKYIYVYLAK